jgi:lactoylglutathione lyase
MTGDGSVSMLERPFVVLGIQQVAIGAPDKSHLTRLWIEILGLTLTGSYRSAAENVDEDIVSAGGGRQHCEIDLMQPVDAQAKPRVDEPALNHIGLWVDDLAAAHDWLGERGVRFAAGGIRRGAAGHDVCFIHPRGDEQSPVGGEGVLIELVQAPADVIAALRGAG